MIVLSWAMFVFAMIVLMALVYECIALYFRLDNPWRAAVLYERLHARARHPTEPSKLMWGVKASFISDQERKAKDDCDLAVASGEETWYHAMREEFCEFFAATDYHKAMKEAAQNAAMYERVYEWLQKNKDAGVEFKDLRC